MKASVSKNKDVLLQGDFWILVEADFSLWDQTLFYLISNIFLFFFLSTQLLLIDANIEY